MRYKVKYIVEKANVPSMIQAVAGIVSIYGFLNPLEGLNLPTMGMSIAGVSGAGALFLPFSILGILIIAGVYIWQKKVK